MKTFRTVISTKGQVVVPAPLRAKFGLAKGTPANWIEEDGRLILRPIGKKKLDELMGCLAPKPGEETMFEALFAERQRERDREKK